MNQMRMKEVSELQFAYMAGLFDGEGYIRFSFKPHWHGRKMNTEFWITVTNSYVPLLEHLRMMFGGSIYQPKPKQSGFTPFWKLTSGGAFILLSRIAPYLKIKRQPANLVLKNKALITKKGPKSDADRRRMIALTKKMEPFTKRGISKDT